MLKILLFISIISSTLFSGENRVQTQILKGQETTRYISDLATLRISYFREYPYFYQVNPSAEKEYLETYSISPNTLFVVAGEESIGILTGCPLTESAEHYQRPFIDNNRDLDKVFCLGEFVFQNGYENEIIQKKMYKQLEEQIQKEQIYNQILVYELVQLENEFAPPGYVSIEEFWNKMGFIKQDDLTFSIPWEDSRTNRVVDHSLVAWLKNIE